MKHLNTNGFTLVEVIITVMLSAIIITIFATFIGRSLNNYTREQTKTTLQANTKLAVESVAKDVRSAKLVETHNTQSDSHSPTPTPYGWTSTTGSVPPNSDTLVMAVPSRKSDNSLIYLDGQHNSICTDDVVYYIDSTSKILYRRLIAASGSSCDSTAGNVAITTCPAGTSGCPIDAKVVEDVATFGAVYYDSGNNVAASPGNAFAVQLSLTQTQVKGSHTYASTYSTIASLRNK